jgi:molybdate transport system ATP-binding protein
VAEHDEAYELTAVDSAWGRLWIRRLPLAPGARTRVLVLARDVSLGLSPDRHSSILNELAATVLEAEPGGPGQVLVRLGNARGGVLLARITRRSYDAPALAPGSSVQARVKSVSLFD